MERGPLLQTHTPWFWGKTLSLLKSMYHNDSLKFLINGTYSDELWLTQGVKQGENKYNFKAVKITHKTYLGCNLSPLLFCIFINNLGIELNSSGLGIDLSSINISSIFFADDLVLLGKSRSDLNKLMGMTQTFANSSKFCFITITKWCPK